MSVLLLQADARHLPLADESVHCVCTSPPYFGLRDYGVAGQIGLERRPDCLGWATGAPCGECFVCAMVAVFREVRRVLRSDGVCWLNLGDSYAGGSATGAPRPGHVPGVSVGVAYEGRNRNGLGAVAGLKPKDRIGIPWRVALALQADGWWLRSEVIWAKPNPMPSSVTDRPTDAHETVFLLTKSARYWYDAAAVREPSTSGGQSGNCSFKREASKRAAVMPGQSMGTHRPDRPDVAYDGSDGRNRRTVWTVATRPYSGAHFATWPEALVEPMILAGCPEGGIVLDPFCGSGTTLRVAVKHRRRAIGCDINGEYLRDHAAVRTVGVQPTLALGAA